MMLSLRFLLNKSKTSFFRANQSSLCVCARAAENLCVCVSYWPLKPFPNEKYWWAYIFDFFALATFFDFIDAILIFICAPRCFFYIIDSLCKKLIIQCISEFFTATINVKFVLLLVRIVRSLICDNNWYWYDKLKGFFSGLNRLHLCWLEVTD